MMNDSKKKLLYQDVGEISSISDTEFKLTVVKALSELIEKVELIEKNASDFDEILKKQREESDMLHREFVSAFPARDVDGHRRYHESVIEWSELRNKMVREAMMKCAGATGVAALGWLLYAIWVTFKMEIQK